MLFPQIQDKSYDPQMHGIVQIVEPLGQLTSFAAVVKIDERQSQQSPDLDPVGPHQIFDEVVTVILTETLPTMSGTVCLEQWHHRTIYQEAVIPIQFHTPDGQVVR